MKILTRYYPVIAASHFLLLALSLLLSAISTGQALASAPAPYNSSSLQFRFSHNKYQTRWGRYTVVISGDYGLERLSILDGNGRLQRQIDAPDILTVNYPVLAAGHLPVLLVQVASGGVAESSEHTYLFSGEHGVHNILALTGEITQIRHSEGGGMADLIADSSVPLEYFTGFDHYGCGNVMLVMRWNGSRYVLANRRFPWVARRRAQADRQKLVAAAGSKRRDPEQVGAALGACANLWTVGQGNSYYSWFRMHMTKSGWQWFLRAQPELRRRMSALGTMVSVSTQRSFVVADV